MDPLTIIAGIGTLGGLFQGAQANKNAKASLRLQQDQANRQAQLFQQTSPYYAQLVQALAGYAGLGGQGGPAAGGGGSLGSGFLQGTGWPGLGGGHSNGPGAIPNAQLPYTNVTPEQLGPYAANPTDALRLRASEDEARTGLNSALRNFSFGQGTRGLFGSSIDAAGRAALVNSANEQQSGFARQLAINAPGEAAQRLQALGNALNPGLGAGPTAAGIYGQVGNTYAQQGQQYNGMASNALQSYLTQDALRRYQAANSTTNQPWDEGYSYGNWMPGLQTT